MAFKVYLKFDIVLRQNTYAIYRLILNIANIEQFYLESFNEEITTFNDFNGRFFSHEMYFVK